MSALETYIEHKNNLKAAFGFEPIRLPLTQEGAMELRNALEADMSPENLSCDGELAREQVQQRRIFYAEVEAELDRLAPAGVSG